MHLEGLDHIALSVRDVEQSVQWYVEVLGLERQHEAMWGGVPKFVGKGATGIAFFPAEGNDDSLGRSGPGRMLHFALRGGREDFFGSATRTKAARYYVSLRGSRDRAFDLFLRSGWV